MIMDSPDHCDGFYLNEGSKGEGTHLGGSSNKVLIQMLSSISDESNTKVQIHRGCIRKWPSLSQTWLYKITIIFFQLVQNAGMKKAQFVWIASLVRRPRRLLYREELLVDLVHPAVVRNVLQENGAFDHVLVAASCSPLEKIWCLMSLWHKMPS